MKIKIRAFDLITGEVVTEESSGLTSAQILNRYTYCMLSTGLFDVDGKEIYENDIIEFTDKWEWYKDEWWVKFAFAEEKEKIRQEYDALPLHTRVVQIDSDGVNFSTADLKEGRWKVTGTTLKT